MDNDTISRQAAIDDILRRLDTLKMTEFGTGTFRDGVADGYARIISDLKSLPSAQPGIIRCKDCKYRDENWRRVSVRWLPCMDVRTDSNWYCGSAERKDDE